MDLKKLDGIREEAKKIIKKEGKRYSYELATEILYLLQGCGFCIWQTYTKEDVAANIGRRPTNEEMQELADSLQCFENIRNI